MAETTAIRLMLETDRPTPEMAADGRWQEGFDLTQADARLEFAALESTITTLREELAEQVELCAMDLAAATDTLREAGESLRAAIKAHADGTCPYHGDGCELCRIGATLREERDEARRERDLAIAHDRQPYPTAWAYEQVCARLTAKTEEAADLAAIIERALACLGPLHESKPDGMWVKPGRGIEFETAMREVKALLHPAALTSPTTEEQTNG